MVCADTLKIKNFPTTLTNNEKEDFLKHFGATHVKIITSKLKQKSIAFAKFESKQVAKAVLHRIHQIKLLDNLLYAEYAPHEIDQTEIKLKSLQQNDVTTKKYYKTFITKLNAFNHSVAFNQPPPSHLKYIYPKPNRATINNIAHALASVPKFYTQVLHLMNRMNLPPPFASPEQPPVPKPTEQPIVPQESSESEIESDPDEPKNKEIIPIKRKLSQKKQLKRPKFIKPNILQPHQSTKESPGDVFEKVDFQQHKKIELKVTTESLENKTTTTEESTNVTVMGSNSEENEIAEKSEFISESELNANRIPIKDLSVLPVFKDYHPGIPSSRLYIKNIAKAVEKADLEYIFGRYNVGGDKFDIRLMQEGRMKGQAFINFNSVEMAQKAIKDTNGFIVKDKPLVVVFARINVKK